MTTAAPAPHLVNDDGWTHAAAAIRAGRSAIPSPWQELYGPLHSGSVDDLMVVGQVGQSLDGRIATPTGHSHYINGIEGLMHLHRLRALVDAVVVGVGTVIADDPLLTVRRVAGEHPARVIIDPNGRLPPGAHVLAADGVRRIVVTAAPRREPLQPGVEVVVLPCTDGRLDPAAILLALAAQGLRRVLIEGGASTISRFLAAGCLDRLHIVVAPLILGAGPASVTLPSIERVDEAIRPRAKAHLLGSEVLFDCCLSAQRRLIGRAKKST